jgi:hypothetical protein
VSERQSGRGAALELSSSTSSVEAVCGLQVDITPEMSSSCRLQADYPGRGAQAAEALDRLVAAEAGS